MTRNERFRKWLSDWLCRRGIHKFRYIADHAWCINSIAGCDHARCAHCGDEFCRVYPEHHMDHRYPEDGEKVWGWR
jgi:hypothetical protein